MKSLSAVLAVVLALSAAAPLWAQTPETDALRVLAEQGDAEAQYAFGCMHDVGCLDETVLSNGQDLEIDSMGDAEAARWYRLAAEQGHAAAQSRLGDFHQFGYGVPQDYAEAVRWYRSAAEQGGAVAQFNLGVRYAIGRGVPQDDGEAVRWCRLAAEQGYVDAQWNLGLMYEGGVGVPQDYVVAYVWLNLSASRRNSADSNRELVAYGRDRVAGKMNPDQFAEAQRLAHEWDAAHPREP